MKHRDDASEQQENWPILQSIAARQAERPSLLSAAEKEARWQFQSQPTNKLQTWPAAPSIATQKAHQIASQLRHLAASASLIPSAPSMNNISTSAQAAASGSVHALFQRLARGEQKPSAQAGESRLTGQVANK